VHGNESENEMESGDCARACEAEIETVLGIVSVAASVVPPQVEPSLDLAWD
jgi:copper chaperone CopZ